MVTYLVVRPPKLRRSSVLLIGVLLFLVGVFFLFLVLIIIVLLFGLLVLLGMIIRLGRLVIQPQVEENIGDIVMHGRC